MISKIKFYQDVKSLNMNFKIQKKSSNKILIRL